MIARTFRTAIITTLLGSGLAQADPNLEQRVAELEAALASLQANTVLSLDGVLQRVYYHGYPTARFSGVNVQIVNGSGATGAKNNGLGNLVVGYNEKDSGGAYFCSEGAIEDGAKCKGSGYTWDKNQRTGSHNLVVGIFNSYTSFGGVAIGANNIINRRYASVTGGRGNRASGEFSTVGGGRLNVAQGHDSSVTGGYANGAYGGYSSVSGGGESIADGPYTSVSGGNQNTAAGEYSVVAGGRKNYSLGFATSVSGGEINIARGRAAAISGGKLNEVIGDHGSVSGGLRNEITGNGWFGSVQGGEDNVVDREYSSIAGGLQNRTTGTHSTVTGGRGNTASSAGSSVSGGSEVDTDHYDWCAGSYCDG